MSKTTTKRNNTRTTSNMNKRKKFFHVQRSAILLTVFFATIVAIAVGSFKILSTDCKVVWTQFQMMYCYSEIENLQGVREHNLEMAYTYPIGASGYVHIAEEADAEITHLNEVRSGYVHSNDPIIAWAAKDGFELSIFLISLAILLLFIALVVVAILFRSKLFIIYEVEILVFDSAMFGLFYVLKFLFARFFRIISQEYNFFNRWRKWDLDFLRKDLQPKFEDIEIIPYNGKKKKRRRGKKVG